LPPSNAFASFKNNKKNRAECRVRRHNYDPRIICSLGKLIPRLGNEIAGLGTHKNWPKKLSLRSGHVCTLWAVRVIKSGRSVVTIKIVEQPMVITRAKQEHPNSTHPSTHPQFFKRKRDKTAASRHMSSPWKTTGLNQNQDLI